MKQLIFLMALWGLTGSAIAEDSDNDGHHRNNTDENRHHWMAPANAAKRINPVQVTPASITRGRQLYVRSCANCHGDQARGDGPASAALTPKPANLRKMAGRHPDGDLAWKIASGRGAMPRWKNMLGKNQIWDLVNYIQSLATDKQSKHQSDDHQHGQEANSTHDAAGLTSPTKQNNQHQSLVWPKRNGRHNASHFMAGQQEIVDLMSNDTKASSNG